MIDMFFVLYCEQPRKKYQHERKRNKQTQFGIVDNNARLWLWFVEISYDHAGTSCRETKVRTIIGISAGHLTAILYHRSKVPCWGHSHIRWLSWQVNWTLNARAHHMIRNLVCTIELILELWCATTLKELDFMHYQKSMMCKQCRRVPIRDEMVNPVLLKHMTIVDILDDGCEPSQDPAASQWDVVMKGYHSLPVPHHSQQVGKMWNHLTRACTKHHCQFIAPNVWLVMLNG